MLNNLDFEQQVTQERKKCKKIIDQISSNAPLKIVYTNVILCPSKSDQDASYIIAKIQTNKHLPRFNNCNMKYFQKFQNFNIFHCI